MPDQDRALAQGRGERHAADDEAPAADEEQ